MSSPRLAFDQLVLQAIDESLGVMGEEPKKALYQYLLSIHSLKTEEIPSRIGDFVTGLKKALGTASKVIERLVLKKLYSKIGITFQELPGLDFSDYIEDARRKFEVQTPSVIGTDDPAAYWRSKKAQFSR